MVSLSPRECSGQPLSAHHRWVSRKRMGFRISSSQEGRGDGVRVWACQAEWQKPGQALWKRGPNRSLGEVLPLRVGGPL